MASLPDSMKTPSASTMYPTPVADHGHILLVDDDPQLRLLVARFMQKFGYRVSSAGDGRVMQEIMGRTPIDIVLLDIMLPGRSGLDLCSDLRRKTQIPIIMLTARGDESDRVAGLEVGADDYITKPFSPRELLARVRALLRRTRTKFAHESANRDDIVQFDGWSLDMRRRELTAPSGTLIDLSTGEYDLLCVFVEHANRVLSREVLMELAKTRTTDPFDRTIDVQISRLRKKLTPADDGSQIIKTIRGAGYMFAPSVAATAEKEI